MQRSSSQWLIHGGHRLSGTVTTNGSKNSTLAILSASLLTLEPILLANVPRISDVEDMVSILQSIGCQAAWEEDSILRLQRPLTLDVEALDVQAAKRTRAVVLLIAGLAQDHAAFDVPHPGGCSLGDRSLDPHIDVLDQFGLQVCQKADGLRVLRADVGNTETTTTLVESGDTVTENAILAAVARRQGCVRICNASCNYMVQDLCSFLLKMDGVIIEGIGSSQLTIHRCESKMQSPITYSILEDPIEAFLLIAAAVVTRGSLRIVRVPIAFIALELRLLQKMGLNLQQGPQYASASEVTMLCDLEIFAEDHALKAPKLKIHPNIYPFGINVDNLPAFGPIAAVSEGRTLLHDWMYEERASYYSLLRDFGVDVEFVDAHRAYVGGPAELAAANCRLPPALRPASMVLLAALASPGVSCLDGVDVLSRGYEDMVRRLRSVQARIDIRPADVGQPVLEGVVRSVM